MQHLSLFQLPDLLNVAILPRTRFVALHIHVLVAKLGIVGVDLFVSSFLEFTVCTLVEEILVSAHVQLIPLLFLLLGDLLNVSLQLVDVYHRLQLMLEGRL